MPQLSLYLNDQAFGILKSEAARAKRSVSGFVSQLVMEHGRRSSWPPDYWTEVYGGLVDETFQVPEELDSDLDGALPTLA